MTVPGKKATNDLSETLALGSGEDFEVFCQPCDRDDLRLPAVGYCINCEEYLCDSCFNTHRRPKPLRHHELIDKAHMPKSQTRFAASNSSRSGQSDDLTYPCTRHKKETIKFYCNDHNVLLCNVCVTLEHTPLSCRVDYIPDISGQTIDSTEVKYTLTELAKITEEYQKISTDLKQVVAKSNTSLTDVLTEITKFRQEINQKLDELEKEAKDAAKNLQQENDTMLKTTETVCGNTIQSVKATSDMIKHLNTTKKADQLFIELKNADQAILDNVKRLSQLTTADDIIDYIFESSPAIETLLQNQKSLGTFTSKQQPSLQTTSALTFSARSPPTNISVKFSSDKRNCFITGITTSYPNQMFVADYKNFSIKMVDTNNQSIQKLSLDSEPWDVTTITREELAVTMPANGTIQFLSISSNRLSTKNTLKVDGKCYGISYNQGKLAVTFVNPKKLTIMDLKGTVLVNVTKNTSGENIFQYPEYVATNSHSIYVSNYGKKEVVWLDWQGVLLGSYGGLEDPRGLAVLADGSFVVSDSSYGKCNILNITGDCGEGKIVVNYLKNPMAIFWCEASKSLYVSSNRMYEDAANCIQVYKMS